MTGIKIGFGTALVFCVTAGWPALAARPYQDAPRASDLVAVDLKITVEGMASLPEDSKVELRGLDSCEASATVPINADGLAKFSRVPVCKVVFKILIPGPDTGIVQVDIAKYKGVVIRIHMASSGPANATILNTTT